jgi:putative membrane protein
LNIAKRHEQVKPISVKVVESQLASEYLANERTFLAWIRTSIAVISLGFLIAKFSIWLNQLAEYKGAQIQRAGASLPIGVTMMLFGAGMSIMAYFRFNTVNRQIEAGHIQADKGMVGIVTLFIVALSLVVVAYMIKTSGIP